METWATHPHRSNSLSIRCAADNFSARHSAPCYCDRCGHPVGNHCCTPAQLAADVSTMMLANVGVSMPVLGLLLAYLFAIVFKNTPFWLPPSPGLPRSIDPRHW